MFRRAKSKMAIRTLRLRNMQAGAVVGLLLLQFFFMDFLQQCGDVELNPGPNPPGDKNDKGDKGVFLRQTRLQSTSQKGSAGFSPSQRIADPVSKGQSDSPSLSDILSTINSMNSSLNQKMDEIRDDLNKKMDNVRDELGLLRGQYGELQTEVGQLRGEMEALRRENQNLTRKVDDLQGRSKRNNIIVHGVAKLQNETSADCENILKDLITDKLELTDDIHFDRVHRINSRSDSPIIACCTFFKQKQAILKARRELRGTNIYINEDFTDRVRNVRKSLSPHLKKAREDGKRATLIFDHLLIDGKKFGIDDGGELKELR